MGSYKNGPAGAGGGWAGQAAGFGVAPKIREKNPMHLPNQIQVYRLIDDNHLMLSAITR